MVYTIIFTLMMVVGLLCSFVASFDVPWQRRTVVGTSSLPLKVSSQFRNGGQKLPFQPQQCVGRTLRAKNLVELTAAATSENEEDDDALFDLIVLGAGPVGVSAALASAELGKKVCLVDAPAYSGALMKGKEDLSFGGPTGLFSKALRDTSKRLSVSTLRGMGISEDSIWAEARLVCEQLAAVNSRDRRRALRSAGITYVQGFARFAAKESGPPSGPASVHRVLVETAAAAAATTAMRTAEDVAELFDSLDVDKNGHLSFEEFKQAQFGSEGSINGGGGGSSGDVAGEEGRRASAAADTAVAIQGVNVLVATGSRAFKPLNIPFARAPSRLFDSDTINGLSFLPKSIAITGSGIIAIEYAKIFQKLGADVTLIIRDKVPKNALMKVGLDSDLAAALVTDLVRSGIAIERGVVATHFDLGDESTATASSTSNKGKSVGGGQGQGQNQGGNKDEAWGGLGDDMLEQSDLAEASLKARKSVKITLAPRDGESDGEAKDEKVLEVDCYLAAVGRVSNTAGLGLDERVLGPDQELKELVDAYGGIKVANGYAMETCVKRVYAAGDVVGRPYLASTGVAQGAAAVSHMFEKQSSSEGSGSGALFDLSADPFAFPVCSENRKTKRNANKQTTKQNNPPLSEPTY